MESERELREASKVTECVFGLVGDGFAIVAADASTGIKFIGPETTRDKIMVFDSHKLIAAIGHAGDRRLFTKHIKKEARSFKGTPLTTADAANFIRDQLANFIRDERAAVLNCSKASMQVGLMHRGVKSYRKKKKWGK